MTQADDIDLALDDEDLSEPFPEFKAWVHRIPFLTDEQTAAVVVRHMAMSEYRRARDEAIAAVKARQDVGHSTA